ncbi:MAG: DinB family protein [Blastocatellia bacterium]
MASNEITELLAYLDSTQKKLIAELSNQDLNHYPADGGWSSGQVVAHLIKTEKYLYPLFSFVPRLIRSQMMLDKFDWLNTALNKLAGMSFLSLGDQTPKDFVKTDMATFRGRFKAPAFLKPRRKIYDLDALLQKREAARAKTLAALHRADLSRLKELRFSHPILGSFSLLEFVMFIGKHEEWHTEQLKRIKASIGN